MKNYFLFLIIIAALLVVGSGCATDQARPDNIQDLFEKSRAECGMLDCSKKFSVETQKASGVGSNMLQINGQIAMAGGSTVWWFEYSAEKDFSAVASTEPETLTGVGKKPVKVDIKKLDPNTKYYYRVVGFNEKQGKVDGAIGSINTVDPSCFGSGTLSAFAGTGMIAFGATTANPVLVGCGVGVCITSIFDEEIYGNASNPKCKAVAGLLGGTSGYAGGKAYKDANKQKPTTTTTGTPPPIPPPSTGTGPGLPPGIP